MVVSPEAPCSSSASISLIGTPHNPNPPTASTAPSGTSATACPALTITLSIDGLPFLASDGGRRRQRAVRSRSRGRHLRGLGGDRRVNCPGGVQQGLDAVPGGRPGGGGGGGDGRPARPRGA